MHVLVTGGTGTIGRFVVQRLLAEGHAVTLLGRRGIADPSVGFQRYDLTEQAPRIPEGDVLVHCALAHVDGKFRGGEGDDPEGFVRANSSGTVRLFRAARLAGCKTIFFLSSRAVYGDERKGEILRETDTPMPDTLYGEAKRTGEEALRAVSGNGLVGIALRATGVYGCAPGSTEHKWALLFDEALGGKAISPRKGTEVHGEDLADAIICLLNNRAKLHSDFEIYNVSDLMLDRHDLLAEYRNVSGVEFDLPPSATNLPGEMSSEKLRSLGWSPGGMAGLRKFLESIYVSSSGTN